MTRGLSFVNQVDRYPLFFVSPCLAVLRHPEKAANMFFSHGVAPLWPSLDSSVVLPVEVATLFDSTDQLLRTAAASFLRTCSAPPGQGERLLIYSVPGGGAAEVSRYLATVACRTRRCRLLSENNAQPHNIKNAVYFGQYEGGGSNQLPSRGGLTLLFSTALEAPLLAARSGFLVLQIPPLASRPKDALKAALFLTRSMFPAGSFFTDDACELIRDYCWPGDLAHMRVTLGLVGQRAFVTNTEAIDAETIRFVLKRKELNLAELCRRDQTGWGIALTGQDLLHLATFTGFARVRKALELLLIEGAVTSFGGNTADAAKFLGLPYTTLVSRQEALRTEH